MSAGWTVPPLSAAPEYASPMGRGARAHLRRCAAAAVVAGAAAVLVHAGRRRPSVAQTTHTRMLAEDIIRRHGGDPFAYFALRKDRSWFFSATNRAFLAYTDVGHIAYVSGDPIGDPAEFPQLIADFREFARERSQHLVFMATAQASQTLYAKLGMRSLYIGEEASIDARHFTLEGPKNRKVRQAVNRVRRAGYSLDVVKPADVDPATRAQLRAISVASRRGRPERGFTMTMDALFRYPDTLIAIARDRDGNVGGFAQLLPSGSSVCTMPARRRRTDAPNGLDEFMIAEVLAWAGPRGVQRLSINFASLGRYLRRETGVVHWGLAQVERRVPMRRLQVFADRFSPEWSPRFVTFERYADLPAALLACGRLEGFVPSPRKPAAPDLASS